MATYGCKPTSNAIPEVASSDEEEEFYSDDNGLEDENDHDKDWNNYDGNNDDGHEYTYTEPPSQGKPAPPTSDPPSKWTDYALSQVRDIALIYIKFAILAIIIYSAALWYTVRYGDIDSENCESVGEEDTCPAVLPA